MSIISLSTDFGIQDEYVGVLKGVMLKINPLVTLVDVTHGIDPQDVQQAAYLLRAAYAYFPAGTIHMAVVDPGVGSQRKIIIAYFRGHYFIAPDNGLLPGVWHNQTPDGMVSVENSDFFLNSVSHTFHGRDIFAPVAAHLSLGRDIADFGPPITLDALVPLAMLDEEGSGTGTISGHIISVDHFGNLISDISVAWISRLVEKSDQGRIFIQLGDHRIWGISATYSQVKPGEMVAVIGSRNCLEVAVNGGSAAQRLAVSKGAHLAVGVDWRNDPIT